MSIATFPELPGIEWSVYRSPSFSTRVETLPSFRDVTGALYTRPRYRFEASYALLRSAAAKHELQDLAGFFLSAGGRYERFLVRDPADCQLVDSLIGTANGTIDTFIVARNTGPSFYEAVDYVSTLTAVKVAGSTVSASTYDLIAPNLIHFHTPPAAGASVAVTCDFRYVCRFDDDALEFVEFESGKHNNESIVLFTTDYQ